MGGQGRRLLGCAGRVFAISLPYLLSHALTPAHSPDSLLLLAVVPVLMQGMMELNRKRPADPIDFLCTYLQQHNPKQQKKATN